MIRVPVPSLLAALWMGRFWRNVAFTLACCGLLVFCLSPMLKLADIVMPWMPEGDVNFWWIFFGMFAMIPLAVSLPTVTTNAWNAFWIARAISRARRLFYGLKQQEKTGKIFAELRAVSHDGIQQTLEFDNNLAHAMPREIYQQAWDVFVELRDLPPAETTRLNLFVKRARRIIDLLERQKRDELVLESDEAMIDKMERDYLYLISRLNQIQTAVSLRQPLGQDLKSPARVAVESQRATLQAKEEERLMISNARRAQIEHWDRLRDEVSHEVLSMEERLAYIHDALSLHGHPEVIHERLYLPSPLMAELQALSWENL